jgi:DNA-binding NtrC family response regulator
VSSRVLVFSADEFRGKILEKVLDRNGFECLVFNRILESGDEIVQHSPEVAIIDTERCFSEEINHLKNICQTLKHETVIVLGKETVINRFKGPLTRKVLCLYDPIDPELIAVKIEEIVSGKKKKWKLTESDMFEKTLKHLLHLD